jgi:hypothetical protein
MKRLIGPQSGRISISLAVAAAAILLAEASMRPIGAGPLVVSQAGPDHDEAPAMASERQHMMHMQSGPHSQNDSFQHMTGATPTLAGQDAFGAIHEIVRILEADPATDWSKVDLESVRQHLIDMNQVTLDSEVVSRPIDGGFEAAVTGEGRTLAAIQRMVPAHARAINGVDSWRVETQMIPNGVVLTVTSSASKEIEHIRGLGFIGVLVRGSHHRHHHLAMARGEFPHGK